MAEFTYNLQFPQFRADQVEDRGVTCTSSILAEFDSLDWRGMVDVANDSGTCSPTMSVKNLETSAELGLTAIGDVDSREHLAFLVFYFPARRSSWFPAVVFRKREALPVAIVDPGQVRELLGGFLDERERWTETAISSAQRWQA